MDNKIEKYFELLLVAGVNLKKGQKLVIRSEVDCFEYVHKIAEIAYKLGAKQVIPYWNDAKISRMTYLNADNCIFDEVEPWHASFYNALSEEGAAFLALVSSDPENLKGVESSKIIRRTKVLNNQLKEYRKKSMSNQIRWCVAGVAGKEWAKKVFPNEEIIEKSIEKLWKEILISSRVDEETINSWNKHTNILAKRAEILNNYNFKSLHFKNKLGTDLHVELCLNHIWEGGENIDVNGIPFSPNIPTEEIFTAPKKDGVNGIVKSSKPFIYNGNKINNFSVIFENGKAVKVEAEENKELLEKIINIDENAGFLGEVALVPYHSPISLSNVIFFNTLYDENASCHLAFGKAYPHCVKNAIGKSSEELVQMGLNESDIHEDFMIGTEDLIVSGVTFDGKIIKIIENGDFIF